MRTTISKQFRWEMGHRLPFHNGLCKNIHGHSYEAHVILSGEPDAHGMVMDYFDMKLLIQKKIDELDHAFLCDTSDTVVRSFLEENSMKSVLVEFPTTAENIARMLLEHVISQLPAGHRVDAVRVRVFETEKTFAEVESAV
ncbi:MAG: 6-pyruvoyl tetrahydropterin synthase family protein [Ignavibacteria bacterium]|nr:6-pyruvoyl tetrahydropterin synthase family protein [Ignavibacteria bacterium]MBP6510580.1 6-pyruvoyl tetrahydropterin synthase family protein [Candidatus Kapabacteria bacterium]MBK6420486.1 6-pyruvoyl tetrahydropterin synthase family protein [Ignavibacteria bacterium]MBK6761558.1 6-pyruvoyl tetrahydropterin synthase family protein [Ignavibacteria bacterium]MBK7033583.1 6-pyruvoyl tetrahydropterin synthase family protein [Ignavibacteria bacterium]